MMQKVVSIIVLMSALCWILGAADLAYMEYFDNPVLLYHKDQSGRVVPGPDITFMPELPGPVRPGSAMVLHVRVCQSRPGVPGTGVRFLRSLSGGYLYFFATAYINPVTGCTDHTRIVRLPEKLLPGKYEYVFQGLYQVNWVKTVLYDQPPIVFEVVP